ncbi:hypothetical protein BDV32DRAFT_106894 [Aspergillus pseudonomiae]|nr:hypothetical protein BDV32DRAFT_106894 [Aspergillus pseudonomiae]
MPSSFHLSLSPLLYVLVISPLFFTSLFYCYCSYFSLSRVGRMLRVRIITIHIIIIFSVRPLVVV